MKKKQDWYTEGWFALVQHTLVAKHGADGLLVTLCQISGSKFNCVALEMKVGSNPLTEGHAHDAVGDFDTLPKAMRAAERYAKRWKARKKRLAACGCGPIEKRRRMVSSKK